MDAREIMTTADPVLEAATVEEEKKGSTDRLLLSKRILPKMAAGLVVIAILFFSLRSAPTLLSLNIKTAQAHAATLSKVSVDRAVVMDHKEFWYRIYESR